MFEQRMGKIMATLLPRASVLAVLLVICGGCGPKGLRIPIGPKQTVKPPSHTLPPDRLENLVGPANGAAESPKSSPSPEELNDKPVVEPPAIEPSAAPVPAVESPAKSAVPPETLYFDSFGDLTGSIHKNTNGAKSAEGPKNERMIYFFNGMPEDGTLLMQIYEDHQALGPDGQPGLLSLSWQELPAKLPWSGFVYLGGATAERRLTLPPLKQVKAAEDLRGMRVGFRFRGKSADSSTPVNMKIGCRLEPALADSYVRRIDLGTFVATDEWGTFDFALSDGTNIEAFLRCLAEENPPAFKIVWAQSGPVSSYHAGDTLLIDDVTLTRSKAE
jgi:hypothetical protein